MGKTEFFKKIVGLLPGFWRRVVYLCYYRRLIKRGGFQTQEREAVYLRDVIKPGDWVLDIGANIGHYTKCFSDLVGENGRVIAMEPIPKTFSFLASNTEQFRRSNISLLNVAASNRVQMTNMKIPFWDNGRPNYSRARLSSEATGLSVLAMPMDNLKIERPVSVVKIDVEGYELEVLQGMIRLIERDHPLMVVETESLEVVEWARSAGYETFRLEDSPNRIFIPAGSKGRTMN